MRTRVDRNVYTIAPHTVTTADGTIRLKKCRLAIRVPRFVIYHTIEDAPACYAASRVAVAMVFEIPCCCKRRRTLHAYTCYLANDDPNS
ncbi:hypothetical protein TNCV_2662191 [Trichonephila clavipes]|nr:hypothetical protein TNCV_2662191 [Trichonephila clavipes]